MPRASSRRLLIAAAVALSLGPWGRSASAQCTVGPPYEFLSAPGPYSRFRTEGYVNSIGVYEDGSGARRLLSVDNYGYYVFSLGTPGAPSHMGQLDIEQTVPRLGDTFSILGPLAVAPDGSRALVSTGHTAANGVLLMKGASSSFAYGGDFKPTGARDVVLDQVGSKWWGYALKDGYLYAADVTSFWTGIPSTKPGSIASDFHGIGSVVPRSASVANHLIVFATGGGMTVVDARNPTSYFPYNAHSATSLGFPAGTSLERVSAVTRPNGTVLVVAEGVVNGNQTAGFVMGTLSADGGTFTQLGNRWVPPAPFSGDGSITTGSRPALVSDGDAGDVWIFVWGGSPSGQIKLYGLSANDWETRGTPADLTPSASYQASSSWAYVATTEPLMVGSSIYLYVGATNSAQAIRLSCKAPAPTPSISLAFVNGGVEYPLCSMAGSCSGGRFSVETGQELVAYAYRGGVKDPAPPGGLAWSFGNAGAPSPATGNGQGVHFTFTAPAQDVAVTMSGYPETYTFTGTVSSALAVSATAAPNPGRVGEPVQLGATVTGGTPPYTHTWTFGDGTTSALPAPVHAYANAGTYSVTCSVRDANGLTKAAVVPVTVDVVVPSALAAAVTDTETGAPLVESGGLLLAASGQGLTFTARDGETLAPSVVWRFGDGQLSALNPVTHVYGNNGVADLVYNGSISAGGVTILFSIAVAPADAPPTGAYSYTYADGGAVVPTAVDPGRSVRFTAAEKADAYDWDFGDGGVHGVARSVDHTFPTTGGEYTVTLRETRGALTAVTARPVTFHVPPPPEPSRWMLVGMASTEGQGGAYWRSDVSIGNPSGVAPMTLRIAYLDAAKSVPASALAWSVVTLAPSATRTLVDVLGAGALAEWGLAPANRSGALLVEGISLPADVEPVLVGKTYNTGTGESGTFGLSIPAVRTTAGIRPQGAAWASQLIGLRQTESHYTNLAVVNLGPDDAEVEVRFFDPAGASLGQPVLYQVGPYGIQQRNNVLRDAAGVSTPTDSFRASLTVRRGTGVTAYASVTDVASKDPVLSTPAADVSASYRLPGIIRAAGANGSLFRSDVVLYNSAAAARVATFTYSYRTSLDPSLRSLAWQAPLAAGQVLDIVDFVKARLPVSDGDDTSYTDSFVDVAQDDGGPEPLLLMGRTYNLQTSGSTGLQVKAFGPADTASAAGPKRRLYLTGLRSSTDGTTGFRSNVALFLGTPGAQGTAQVDVKVLDGSGDVKGTTRVTLSAGQPFVQLGDRSLFGGASWDLSTITVVLEVVSGTEPVAAYATSLDNVSNDAVFLPAAPLW